MDWELVRRLKSISADRIEEAERVERHLREVGLPTRIGEIPGPALSAERLMEAIGQDKKVRSGQLTFILTHGIGRAFIADDVPGSEVLAFLTEQLRAGDAPGA